MVPAWFAKRLRRSRRLPPAARSVQGFFGEAGLEASMLLETPRERNIEKDIRNYSEIPIDDGDGYKSRSVNNQGSPDSLPSLSFSKSRQVLALRTFFKLSR